MTASILSRNFSVDPDALTTGHESVHRLRVSSNAITTLTQSMRLTYFTARRTEVEASVRLWTSGTAAAATPTLIRVGLYSVAANGDIALIASTANDTTLLAAANTSYTKSYSASTTLTAGVRYARGILIVTGAATPTFFGSLASTPFSNELALAPRIAGAVVGQNDLPSSVANASIAVSPGAIYSVGLPT